MYIPHSLCWTMLCLNDSINMCDCVSTFKHLLIFSCTTAEKTQATDLLFIKIVYLEGFCHKSKTYLVSKCPRPTSHTRPTKHVTQIIHWFITWEELRKENAVKKKKKRKEEAILHITVVYKHMLERIWWLAIIVQVVTVNTALKHRTRTSYWLKMGLLWTKHGLVITDRGQTRMFNNL